MNDGGNIQNQIVDVATASLWAGLYESLGERRIDLKITVASSSDPFERLPPDLAAKLGSICDVYKLNIPDRFAIIVPWEESGRSGSLAITSEPERTGTAVETLLKSDARFRNAFSRANCFLSSDPIYDQLIHYAIPGYSYIINASTAFRSLVATDSYGRAVILPMNDGEAADVCKLLLQRGLEEELSNIKRPPFPSPLSSSREEIDFEALRILDASVEMFSRYIPVHKKNRQISFLYPVSFGAEGGFLIGADHDHIACFTSTPAPESERLLLQTYGDESKLEWDRLHEVGAGDSVATIITLFNAIDPRLFLLPHAQGAEKHDALLLELASTLFVSLLGRIAGNYLVRTRSTYWANVQQSKFDQLLNDVAGEALKVARTCVRRLDSPVLGGVEKWGIKIVIWRPGTVAYPDRQPE